jgi:hypothetical protein
MFSKWHKIQIIIKKGNFTGIFQHLLSGYIACTKKDVLSPEGARII